MAHAIFQHRITFEPLIIFSKTEVFWNLLTLGQHFRIFILFIDAILIIYNPFKYRYPKINKDNHCFAFTLHKSNLILRSGKIM